jgi:hypothetical protein
MATDLLKQFVDDVFEIDLFIQCSLEGFGYATVAPLVTEKIRSIAKKDGVDHPLKNDATYEKRREHYKKLEEFSKIEEDQGHPYLFSLACVKLWSILEAAVDFMLLELLKDNERASKSVRIGKIRGPLLSFLQASDAQKIEYLKEALLQELGSDLKVGLGKFEAPLGELGFSGDVSEPIRRTLLELNEVPNLVVHKAGVVDRRFKERCPWVPLSEGQKFRVTYHNYRNYRTASLWYLIELDQRYEQQYGEEKQRYPQVINFLHELEESLSNTQNG